MNQSRREFFINAVRAQFGQNLIVDAFKTKSRGNPRLFSLQG
jgi:hypothetical protein